MSHRPPERPLKWQWLYPHEGSLTRGDAAILIVFFLAEAAVVCAWVLS